MTRRPRDDRHPDLDRLVQLELQRRQLSRRRFLGRMGVGLGAFALAPSILAACGDDDETESGSGTTVARTESDTLRISNWPLYIDEETVGDFETASGMSVDYTEDVNDNEEYFAKIREQLDRNQDIGADMFIVTDFMVARLIGLEWLAQFDPANVPNKSNLVASLQGVDFDPDRTYSLPWFSGFSGIAYNLEVTGREITSTADLWDPEFKGKVTLFSDLRDGLGQVLLSQGVNFDDGVTEEQIQAAADKVAEEKSKGQIRRFTGNDYSDDLVSGNVAIAQAYSGDVAQLMLDNDNLRFVVPEEGAVLFSDNMAMPKTTRNLAGAEEWMNYVYDPVNNAKITAYVQYISPVEGVAEELEKIDPTLVDNPLINPSDDVRAQAHPFPTLTEDEEIKYVGIYTDVTGA
jgi:spermidine/putrescine transport system substrate-binding protein